MNRRVALIIGILLICSIGAGAWLGFSPTAARISAEDAPIADDPGGVGPLDGMRFVGSMGPAGELKDIADTFVFENGTFVSKECEEQCDYPARPYYVRHLGDQIEFISESKCTYKDATIIWRGTIDGDRITGSSTWTIRRWYWTLERDFEFAGRLAQ